MTLKSWTRHLRVFSNFTTYTMDCLVSRFASSSSTIERQSHEVDEYLPETSWGSLGGFGNLGLTGVPSFNIPSVPDVRPSLVYGY